MNSVHLHQIINHSMYSEFKIKLPIYAYCTHIDTFKLDVYASQLYAKQKHLGCKKRRGQSEAAVI